MPALKTLGDYSLCKKKGETNPLAGCVAWEMAELLKQKQPALSTIPGVAPWLLETSQCHHGLSG